MASNSKEVETDFSPFLKIYKDGTVERLFASPHVPPSLDDPLTHVSSKDVTISSNVSARLYLPKITDPSTKLPILVYYHGGGFCLGSPFCLLTHRYLNQLVSKANAVAISVDYRLAPEHPLPAAYEDCWEALQWVASHRVVEDSNADGKDPWLISHGDFDKLFLGGDSAGANIVHNMAMRAGFEGIVGEAKILGASLSCPYFCDSKTLKGSKEESNPHRLWTFVFPSAPGGVNNPLINPFADGAPTLSGIGCQKLFVTCAEKDELREIDVRYVDALRRSNWKGVVQLVDVEGEDHCFDAFEPYTEKAQAHINTCASFIKG